MSRTVNGQFWIYIRNEFCDLPSIMYTLDSLGLNYGIGGYTVRIQRPEAKSRFRSPYIFQLLEASHRNKIFFTTKIAVGNKIVLFSLFL